MNSHRDDAPILIVGMHRSGTSATAGLLGRLGVHLGTPAQLQAADAHNLDGYHELREAVALNERLFDAIGAAWDLPPPATPSAGTLLADAGVRTSLANLCARLATEAAAVNRPWGIKDPRLCVLWPAWLELLPSARVVLCVRDPLAVAQSLKTRNGLSLAFGLRLCEQYFAHLLNIPAGRIAARVQYEELVAEPERVTRGLVRELGLRTGIRRTKLAAAGVKEALARNKGRLEALNDAPATRGVAVAYARLRVHSRLPEPASSGSVTPSGDDAVRGITVPALENEGWCPICERIVQFAALHLPLRNHYRCSGCDSLPRERALMQVLNERFPDWRELRIHEFGSVSRPVSQRLQRECRQYLTSYWLDATGGGRLYGARRAERLERLSFSDAEFDLHLTQEVVKHLEPPSAGFAEIARTLRPGGSHVFTVPLVRGNAPSRFRVVRRDDGSMEQLEPEEHHGSRQLPGSLVTVDWGADIARHIRDASGMNTEIVSIDDLDHGIRGEFGDVLISTKLT